MFENKKTHNGIHYMRYINSWRHVGGNFYDIEFFDEWLRSEELTDEEIREIHDLCYCAGKLELEISAKPFVEKQKKAIEELEKEAELEEKREAKIDPKAAKLVRNRVRNHFNEAVNYIKKHADEIIENAAK